ncbi:MAG: hypothetical protein ACLR2E_00775 [Lachnospiraceae bacterium]
MWSLAWENFAISASMTSMISCGCPERTGHREFEKAEAILEEQRKEFDSWYECRDMVPRIQKLKRKRRRICWRVL